MSSCRSNSRRSGLSPAGTVGRTPAGAVGRLGRGSILPVMAIAMPLIVALLAFAIDMSRNVAAVRKLQFAADAAALYASSFGANADGSYDVNSAQANMLNALSDVNGGSGVVWNSAPAGTIGAQSGDEQAGVVFSDADLSLVANPADGQEKFVQVKARRDGNDALGQLISPAINALHNIGGQFTPGPSTVSTYRIAEAIGQPASKVGAAPPKSNAINASRSLAPFAVFPMAISNAQFLTASSPSQANKDYTADVVTPGAFAQAVLPNHFRVAFINVAPSGSTSTPYGTGQGNLAIDQLVGTLRYFAPAAGNAVLPAAVERGVSLSAFNPADPVFVSRQSDITSAFSQVPVGQWLLMPVLASDPSFSNANQVVGFARMQLVQGLTSTPNGYTVSLRIGESIPLRNVSSANYATVPTFSNALLPAPVAPFIPRAFDPTTNSIAARSRGVVMAAAVSPRRLLD
jgi:hypothetical protein